MILPKITTSYIKDKYDIEKEKQYRNTSKVFGQLAIESYNGFTIKQFIKKLTLDFSLYPDDAILELEYYGYDGSFDVYIKSKVNIMETDEQVIERLKLNEKSLRKTQEDVQKAKDILLREGYEISKTETN